MWCEVPGCKELAEVGLVVRTSPPMVLQMCGAHYEKRGGAVMRNGRRAIAVATLVLGGFVVGGLWAAGDWHFGNPGADNRIMCELNDGHAQSVGFAWHCESYR